MLTGRFLQTWLIMWDSKQVIEVLVQIIIQIKYHLRIPYLLSVLLINKL